MESSSLCLVVRRSVTDWDMSDVLEAWTRLSPEEHALIVVFERNHVRNHAGEKLIVVHMNHIPDMLIRETFAGKNEDISRGIEEGVTFIIIAMPTTPFFGRLHIEREHLPSTGCIPGILVEQRFEHCVLQVFVLASKKMHEVGVQDPVHIWRAFGAEIDPMLCQGNLDVATTNCELELREIVIQALLQLS